jgi:hypothetical protein
VVECTRLEIWRTFRRTVSSNLTLSASSKKKAPERELFFRLLIGKRQKDRPVSKCWTGPYVGIISPWTTPGIAFSYPRRSRRCFDAASKAVVGSIGGAAGVHGGAVAAPTTMRTTISSGACTIAATSRRPVWWLTQCMPLCAKTPNSRPNSRRPRLGYEWLVGTCCGNTSCAVPHGLVDGCYRATKGL